MRPLLIFGFRWPLLLVAAFAVVSGFAGVLEWDLALMGAAGLAVISQVCASLASRLHQAPSASGVEAVERTEEALLKDRFWALAESTEEDDAAEAA